MKCYLLPIAIFALAVFALAPAVQAGPVFDDLLNYPVIDQQCPQDPIKEEGMGLISQKRAKFIELTREQSLGQTFRLGPDAVELWRVCVGLCHWPDSWQEGEEVTLSIYDSPTKAKKLYSRTLGFDHKWFKWDVAFDVHAPCKPDTDYYLELTLSGSGDGRINVAYIDSDDYKRGRPYVAGQPKEDFDLYFVVITKPKRDRQENLKRFLSRFDMNHPSLAKAKAAMSTGDLDGACAEVLAAYSQLLRNADWVWRIKPGDKFDTSRMDKVCAEGRLYNNDEGKTGEWIPMTQMETTWREVWPGTAEYVRQNDLFSALGHAYTATGDEKYVRKLDELMADYIQDNATPYDGGMAGGRWVAMFQAWRLGDAWDGMAAALDCKALTDDVKLGWIDYWGRIAHYSITAHSGGNHANAVAEALMSFGSRFPMYADSKAWFQGGFDKLVSNSLTLFYNDGACTEPAMNYHGFSLANLTAGLDTARAFGLEPPAEISAVVEKALAYTAYMLKPNGQIPSYGDTNCEDFRPGPKWNGWRKGEAWDAWRIFGRQDCLYIATAGRQGTRPSSDSYCFPDVGHYIMRSGWGGPNGEGFEDERYMFLRGGRQGSHGHDDMNEITLYAYGRPLLIDPGRTTYGTPLMYELSKNRSHSVLLADDIDRMNRVSAKVNSWHTTPVMDFVDNSYTDLYPGVDHRRAIVFVRPDYYVMFDIAAGTQSHDYGINFWLTPPALNVDEAGLSVCSTEPDGANVMLKVLCDGARLTQRNGTIEFNDKVRDDIPVVTFRRTGESAEFTTVIYPFTGEADMDAVNAQEISVDGGKGCIVRSPVGTDIVIYSSGAAKARLPRNAAAFEGRAGLIRVNDSSFAMVDGTLVELSGKKLARADAPVSELSVRYLPDVVEIACPKPEPTLQIASLGRTKALVNGREVTITANSFRPF